VILGERELETGQVVLRRMATGDQQQVALSLLPLVLAGL
jgi:histidyl-tRNA synthetase